MAARLLHTASYLGLKAQPARFLCFLGGWGVNVFLAYKVARALLF